MSLNLTPSLEQKLERVAAQSDRTMNDLAEEVLQGFVDSHEEFLAAVREGMDDFAHGDTFTHEEVIAQIETLLGRR